MDHIEKSNLHRQFLFRPKHVGKSKCAVAAEVIRDFNPEMRITAIDKQCTCYSYRFEYNYFTCYIRLPFPLVDRNTETFFNNNFLQEAATGGLETALPIVLSAVDNLRTRQYLDLRCVSNRLAMFDSGTEGLKGHTQVILPYITESYDSVLDPISILPGDQYIPCCAIRSFPANITHCVEWAREKVR